MHRAKQCNATCERKNGKIIKIYFKKSGYKLPDFFIHKIRHNVYNKIVIEKQKGMCYTMYNKKYGGKNHATYRSTKKTSFTKYGI